MNCKFCDIISGKVEDYIVWEDEEFVVLMNTRPTRAGGCMVIPKKHVEYIFDLSDDLYSKLFLIGKTISKSLKTVTNAKKIGLLVSGFEIPHVHLHLIPLHKPNDFISSDKSYKASDEELRIYQEKIKKHL